jgi:hypothetical protein
MFTRDVKLGDKLKPFKKSKQKIPHQRCIPFKYFDKDMHAPCLCATSIIPQQAPNKQWHQRPLAHYHASK